MAIIESEKWYDASHSYHAIYCWSYAPLSAHPLVYPG